MDSTQKDIVRTDARTKSVREMLDKVKYTVDYYQREYRWETRNIAELIDDLETRFLEHYKEGDERTQVPFYGHYFLGSIVISYKSGHNYIIDGQQRLTSLTLLLIYLHNLQKEIIVSEDDREEVRDLIFSTLHGKRSFNLDIPERTECLEALYSGKPYDAMDRAESVRNITARYQDIEELFPETLKSEALLHFIGWLKENVDLVQITAFSDDEAYTIFETMNDRGLSLSPTDMLKGYLLANIRGDEEKEAANQLWKQRILSLVELGKDDEIDFFKAWLRAKYAQTIRERKKGTTNQDFEKIGTTFHKWIRDERERIGLTSSSDYKDFIGKQFEFYSKQYIRLRKASLTFTPGLEVVYYNAHNTFTLQYPLILASLRLEDDIETINKKIRMVGGYLDLFITRRAVNYRTLSYSAIVYTMFNLLKKIRDLDLPQLAQVLKGELAEIKETFQAVGDFGLHQQNRHTVHYILARLTYFIEQESGIESSFDTYVRRDIKKPFEIEHLWADKYEWHEEEFDSYQMFKEHRNLIGGLTLLQRGYNQSLKDDPYQKKVHHYLSQNLLARSLHPQCYQNNPGFNAFLQRSGLAFKPYEHFTLDSLLERQELYQQLCERVWASDFLDML
jgi:uncharacterized protein with ParB-like and HNH nuclease domain